MIAERFSGNKKIIESDSVILYNRNDKLTLDFMFKERNFDVEISCSHDFIGNPKGLNIFVSGKDAKPDCITDSKHGTTGTEKALKIAQVGEKEIYMHVLSSPTIGGGRKIEYTVFSADK